jgi:hypothetical protein
VNRNYTSALGVGVLGALALVVFWPNSAPPPIPSKRGCDLTMSPRGTLTKGVSGTAQTLTFTSRACATGTVTVSHNGTTVGTCSLSGGSCTYSDTLPDQATTTIQGSITLASVTHTDTLLATMDSLNPEISLTSPNVAGDGSLIVVSGLLDETGVWNNLHLEAGDPGYYADQLPGTDGGGHITIVAVVKGGSDGGSLVTRWQGTPMAATALTVTPQTVTQSVTIPEGAVGVLTITATIGSGATAIAIPLMVDTLLPPTPITYYGVSANPDGGCAPCAGDSWIPGAVPPEVCTGGCGYYPPSSGGFTHVENDRHADLDFAVIVPPDAGTLWENTTTGQPETFFCSVSSTAILGATTTSLGNGCVGPHFSDGGCDSPIKYIDGGGITALPYPDGGTGVDLVYASKYLCSHHYAEGVVKWVP